MVVNKELLYRYSGNIFSKEEYIDLYINFIKLLTSSKTKKEFKITAVPQNGNPNTFDIIFECNSDKFKQTDVFKYFTVLDNMDFTLRYSFIQKDGTIGFDSVDIANKDLFNWYLKEDMPRVIEELKRKKFSDSFIAKIARKIEFTSYKDNNKYICWNNKDVVPFRIPQTLNSFLFQYANKIGYRLNSLIGVEDKGHIKVGDIMFQIYNTVTNITETLLLPECYVGMRIEETRLNEFINHLIIDDKESEISKNTYENVKSVHIPLTSFIDIETNVGNVEGGVAIWDLYDKFISNLFVGDTNNKKTTKSNSVNVLSDGSKSNKKGRRTYKNLDEVEMIDDLLDEDNNNMNSFSEPSDPYQPINTISIAIKDKIIVLSRRKDLSKDDIQIIQDKINHHFQKVRMYQKTPFQFLFVKFDTEIQLIEYLLKNIVSKMSAVSGWNFFFYDWAYIINRYIKILRYYTAKIVVDKAELYGKKNVRKENDFIDQIPSIEIDNNVAKYIAKILSVKKLNTINDKDYARAIFSALLYKDTKSSFMTMKKTTQKGDSLTLFFPNHIMIYDYLEIYSKWDKTISIKENNSLDWTCEQILKVPKLPHTMAFDEFYVKDFVNYVAYNAIDSILVSLLDSTIKTSNIFMSFVATMFIEPNYALSTVKPVTTVMSNFALEYNKVFQARLYQSEEEESVDKSDNGFAGAFVTDPVPGLYKYMVSLDAASLYPSTIRMFSISPEFLLYQCKKIEPTSVMAQKYSGDATPAYCEYLPIDEVVQHFKEEYEANVPIEQQVPHEERIYTVSGAIYKYTHEALIPNVLTYYYNERKKAKKKMFKNMHNLNILENKFKERFPNSKYIIEH